MKEAIILGIIQGIFEWFPVSSSGLLIIFQKFFNFNADIIKKSLQTIESNYNPESASPIENFILENKSRFEEALNLWGDARKSDAITRLLREFEEKNKQSQQPPQNKGMQKSNTDPLGLFN